MRPAAKYSDRYIDCRFDPNNSYSEYFLCAGGKRCVEATRKKEENRTGTESLRGYMCYFNNETY